MNGTNWYLVGTLAALAFCGLIAAMLMRKPLKAACASFMAMPNLLKVALVSIAIVATVQAQKQNGGDGTQGLPTPPLLSPRMLPQTVSDEEIAQGYRFAYETNDIAHNYTMPANATYVGNAHIHGAASSLGRNFVDFGGWSFLFGPSDTRYSSAWWFIDGRVRFAPHDTGREISTGISGRVLAMQGRSRIWHGPCDGGYAICWENVFLGGDTNAAANAQIIMKDNGWFEIWSNEVGRVYKRINQYDWDGDGLDNTIDSTPKAYDGNCFGTGIDWLNANCGAILSASLDADDAMRIDWNPNSSENAYYWLSFTATHDSTRITITCDGPSNLGDMVVIANEGQTCSVPLLIGAVYRILSEIRECDRYKDAWVTLNDCGDQLINTLIFEDFLRHRTELKNRNLARRLPPYDPAEVRKQRGEYKAVVTIPQQDTKRQETMDELIDEMQKALECLRKKTG